MRAHDVRPTHAPSEPTLHEVVAALASVGPGTPADERGRAVDCLDRYLAHGYERAPTRAEAQLIAAGQWLLNDRPDHPVIPVWAARAPLVLDGVDDETLAALLAAFSFNYATRVGDFGEAGRLVAYMWDRTRASAEARLTWLPSAALFLSVTGRPAAALEALRPVLQDAGVAPALRLGLLEQAANAALVAGDAAQCVAYLDDAEALALPFSGRDRAHHAFLRAGAAVVAGDLDAALVAIDRCEACARDVEAGYFRALWRLGASVTRLMTGHARRAERELSGLLGDVVLMRARYLEWSSRLARAAARAALGRPSAAEADMAAGLRIAGQNGYVTCDPWGLTPRLRELLVRAVDRDIEAYAARVILAQQA